MENIFIIAEAGVNHNGDISLAKKMIETAAMFGADAVKFQTFKADDLVCKSAPKAAYQKVTTNALENQYDMLKKLELDKTDHLNLIEHCTMNGIQFLSTPFDMGSIDVLDELGITLFKIPSGEITNLPYLRKIGGLNKKVIISSGMSFVGEIEKAIYLLSESGTLMKNISILHCNSEYPTPFEDVNLKAMLTIQTVFPEVNVGYSDHTVGIEIPIAAVALGARIIEKHFTMDRNMEGPDHRASLEPDEFKRMIDSIRNIEKSLGDGIKKPSESEQKNRPIARKSIVAKTDIRIGDVYSEDNITTKRPATGIDPMRWDELIGQKAKQSYKPDDLIV